MPSMGQDDVGLTVTIQYPVCVIAHLCRHTFGLSEVLHDAIGCEGERQRYHQQISPIAESAATLQLGKEASTSALPDREKCNCCRAWGDRVTSALHSDNISAFDKVKPRWCLKTFWFNVSQLYLQRQQRIMWAFFRTMDSVIAHRPDQQGGCETSRLNFTDHADIG